MVVRWTHVRGTLLALTLATAMAPIASTAVAETTPTVTTRRADVYEPDQYRAPAAWDLTQIPDDAVIYVMTFADGRGREVARLARDLGPCPCEPLHLEWTLVSWGHGESLLPPGTYAGSVTLIDSSGRQTNLTLGPVRLWAWRTEQTHTDVSARAVRDRNGRFIGRCSTIVASGWRRRTGAVGMLSQTKCAARRRPSTLVQRFRLRMPLQRGASVSAVFLDVRASGNGTPAHTAWGSGSTPRHLYRTTFAFPALRIGWTAPQLHSVARGRAEWASVGGWGVDGDKPQLMRADLDGEAMDVRVRVTNGNRIDVRTFRLTYTSSFWSLS